MIAANKPIYWILALSILFTVIIHLNLTKAIFFDNYLNTKQISGVNYYLSFINESSKGNWRLGSPYILEWRDQPYLYPALNINAAGLVKRVLNLDIKSYALLMDYSAVFVLMILLITAFLTLFNFHYFGYLAATFYIFFPRIIEWNRTLSPEINFIPFALFFIFYFWPTSQSAPRPFGGVGATNNFWKRETGMAIFTGALFYIYPYYWTFALALLAISDLWTFWNQKKIIWKHFYKYLVIAGLASWYIFHLWQLYQLPYYQETMVRIGALSSRWPAGWYTQAGLLASLVLFFLLKKYVFPRINLEMAANGALNKITAGLVAGLIVLNQQLVTGMQLEFNSHYLPTILVFLVAFWGSLVFILINNLNSYRKILIFTSFLLLVGLVFSRIHLISGGFGINNYIGGRADEAVNWFLDNQIQDKVVYAPVDLGDEINLWTNNYLVFHGSQELQLMPTAELIDRFIYFDITNKAITENLLDQQVAIFGQTFKSIWQKTIVLGKLKSLLTGQLFTAPTLAEYTNYDFGPIYQKRTHPDAAEFNKYLEKYRVSYLVYRQEDRNSIYKNVPGKIVFESESYLIKKLPK